MNPYETPAARVDDPAVPAGAEELRRRYIRHESAVRSVGYVYYLTAAILLVVSLSIIVGGPLPEMGTGRLLAFLVAAMGAAFICVGWAIRRLSFAGRVAGTIFSALGLLAFPIGTLLNGWILYLLLSAKGNMVFSDAYREVIEATPQVKTRTHIVVWVILVLVLAAFFAGFLAWAY